MNFLDKKMKSRKVELVGFYYSENPIKGGTIMKEQTQYLPENLELAMLMNTGLIEDYKIILVNKQEDDSLYEDGFEFFNENRSKYEQY